MNCAMTYVFLLLVAICIGVIICAGCTGPKYPESYEIKSYIYPA